MQLPNPFKLYIKNGYISLHIKYISGKKETEGKKGIERERVIYIFYDDIFQLSGHISITTFKVSVITTNKNFL